MSWNDIGRRRINFLNGSYAYVNVTRFIYNADGVPLVVEGTQNGCEKTYPWTSILSIGPVKEKGN